MTAGLACERPARPNKLPGVVIGADESDGSRSCLAVDSDVVTADAHY